MNPFKLADLVLLGPLLLLRGLVIAIVFFGFWYGVASAVFGWHR